MTNVINIDFSDLASDIPEVPEVFFFANPTSSRRRIVAKWLAHNDGVSYKKPYDYAKSFRKFVSSSVERSHMSEDPQEVMRELCGAATCNGVNTLSELADKISSDLTGDDLRSMFMDYVSGEHPFLEKTTPPLPALHVVGQGPQ